MKQKLLLLACACALASSSFATKHSIQVGASGGLSFAPSTLTASLGDTISFEWSSGSHTSTSTSVPTGATTWDHPMTSAANNFIYVPTVAGNYAYKCTPHASFGMTGSFTIIPLNVAPVATPLFSMYPNPASATLHLQFSSADQASVQITDMTGRMFNTTNYNNVMTANVDLSAIPNGTYVVHVMQGKNSYTQQLVVAH